mmetsp:Transcript_73657/g.175628  ORF Transcript_73657/g.175628 Transcript_73657/m.175628 type:complete len:486 (-) Transcript_73657:50-1507(-)
MAQYGSVKDWIILNQCKHEGGGHGNGWQDELAAVLVLDGLAIRHVTRRRSRAPQLGGLHLAGDLFPPLCKELLDFLLLPHPDLEIRIRTEGLLHEAHHAQAVVHDTVRKGLGREEGGFLGRLVCIRHRAHANIEALAGLLRRDLRLASRNPLAIDVHGAGLALTLLALVADEDICLARHFAQRLADPCHGHHILGLEDHRRVTEQLVPRNHAWGLLRSRELELLQLRQHSLHLALLSFLRVFLSFLNGEILGHEPGGAEQVFFQLLGVRGRLVQGHEHLLEASAPLLLGQGLVRHDLGTLPFPRGLHAGALLHDAQKRGGSTHNLQGGTGRFGLVSRRPLSSRHLVGALPKLLDQILVQDLVTLIILEDRLPAASGAPSPNDLASLLHGLHPAALARSTVPGPVDPTLRAPYIVQDLEEPCPGFFFSHEASGDVLHEDREVLAEPRPLLPEQRGFGDAAGVDGAKGDARGAMEALVKHVRGHHQS